MYVQVLVETPQKLTKRQKELLQEFDTAIVERNPARSRRFLLQGQGVP